MLLAEPRKILLNLGTGSRSTNNYHFTNVVTTIQISVLAYLAQSLSNTIKGVGCGFNFVDVVEAFSLYNSINSFGCVVVYD